MPRASGIEQQNTIAAILGPLPSRGGRRHDGLRTGQGTVCDRGLWRDGAAALIEETVIPTPHPKVPRLIAKNIPAARFLARGRGPSDPEARDSPPPGPEARMPTVVMSDLRGAGPLQRPTLRKASIKAVFVAHVTATAAAHCPPPVLTGSLVAARRQQHRHHGALGHCGVVLVVDLARIAAAKTRTRLQDATGRGARDVIDARDDDPGRKGGCPDPSGHGRARARQRSVESLAKPAARSLRRHASPAIRIGAWTGDTGMRGTGLSGVIAAAVHRAGMHAARKAGSSPVPRLLAAMTLCRMGDDAPVLVLGRDGQPRMSRTRGTLVAPRCVAPDPGPITDGAGARIRPARDDAAHAALCGTGGVNG